MGIDLWFLNISAPRPPIFKVKVSLFLYAGCLLMQENPDFRLSRRRKSGKIEFFEVQCTCRESCYHIICCSPHSALFGYVRASVRSTGNMYFVLVCKRAFSGLLNIHFFKNLKGFGHLHFLIERGKFGLLIKWSKRLLPTKSYSQGFLDTVKLKCYPFPIIPHPPILGCHLHH